MSTLVLEVQFVDNVTSIDKEFDSLDAVRSYLNGQRETDYEWLCLHDNNTDMVLEGWSDIHQYIRENTSMVKTPNVCPVVCTHGKGLACPVCYDQSHSWEDSEFVVDPFDTYEEGELPSKSSCIALRASELNLPHIDSSKTENVQPVPFSELPDGALFYYAETYAYGSRIKFQKTLEDGGEHNAVHVVNTNMGVNVPDDRMVIPA